MEFESVHNYYEKLVTEYLVNEFGSQHEAGWMADIACVALNHLPPRYIRYDVDMTFYLSPQEAAEMHNKVAGACQKAISYVQERELGKHSQGISTGTLFQLSTDPGVVVFPDVMLS